MTGTDCKMRPVSMEALKGHYVIKEEEKKPTSLYTPLGRSDEII